MPETNQFATLDKANIGQSWKLNKDGWPTYVDADRKNLAARLEAGH